MPRIAMPPAVSVPWHEKPERGSLVLKSYALPAGQGYRAMPSKNATPCLYIPKVIGKCGDGLGDWNNPVCDFSCSKGDSLLPILVSVVCSIGLFRTILFIIVSLA